MSAAPGVIILTVETSPINEVPESPIRKISVFCKEKLSDCANPANEPSKDTVPATWLEDAVIQAEKPTSVQVSKVTPIVIVRVCIVGAYTFSTPPEETATFNLVVIP